MRRWLSVGLALVLITLLEFHFFPGHTYLRSDSQIFVAMIERLAAPAFLSRDFVATPPHLVFTAYDEVTLLLHRLTQQDFQSILAWQQLACRASAVVGIFLLASSAGVKDFPALLIAAVVNMGAALPGAAVSATEPEPVPHAMAFSLCLLALGLLANEKPLLSGFAGGVALAYQPATAAIMWAAVALTFVLNRRLRPVLRPMLTILLVFLLLLANLAQLQPGVIDAGTFFRRISPSWLRILRERTPEVMISTWSGEAIAFYLLVFVGGVIASARIWPSLNRQSRWMGALLLFGGLLSLPLSGILLEVYRWSLVPQFQPARALLFTVALSLAAAPMAASRAAQMGKRFEAAAWCAFALAISVGTQFRTAAHPDPVARPAVAELASWAKESTWGGSMFLFPDAGRAAYPGIFRAESIRAVYADWIGGELSKYFEDFAREWDHRWHSTMGGDFSARRLEGLLDLPVDYYVLRRTNALERVQPVYGTRDFVVYERHALKNERSPLRLIHNGKANY
ncbi:MAG: hypothetical protein ACJ746_21610 [Bryobacteraceae bacterium]